MAGRIPQSFINSLLDRVDILSVVGERVPLKRKGSSYWGCCPFHDEKSPSFHVIPERQFYKCFGCGVSGTALGFVMEYEHLSFPEAIERLAVSCGMEVPREASANPAADREREQLLAVAQAAAEYFQQALAGPRGEPARAYLERRGIASPTVAAFGIGYAPAGWDGLRQALARFDDALLERAGLLARNERGAYDRFRDRLMFPIRNGRGRVIGFGGRVLDAGEPKYLNSPECPIFQKGREVYGLYEARRSAGREGMLVLVEGYMDVVGLAQHGVGNAVAALGTAVSAHQLEVLLKAAPELVCCFDADKAGDTAAWRALETVLPLMTDERRVSFVRLPEGEDPDSLVRVGGAAAWHAFLERRQPLADFFFDRLTAGLRLEGVDDRTALVQRAEPLLARLPAGVRQRLMRDRLRELAQLDRATDQRGGGRPRGPYATAVQSFGRGPSQGNGGAAPTRTGVPASGRGSLARQMLALLVQSPAVARAADLAWLDEVSAADDPVLGLLAEIAAVLAENPEADLGYLIGYFHGHPRQADVQRAAATAVPAPRADWADTFRGGMRDLQHGRGRRVALRAIDSEEALRAQFEARRRREHEQSEQSEQSGTEG